MLRPWIPGWSPRGEMVIPESAGEEHHRVVIAVPFVAEYIRGDAQSLDAADGVLDQDADP